MFLSFCFTFSFLSVFRIVGTWVFEKWPGFPRVLDGKASAAVQETEVQSLGWEDPLEKEMATHSSTLAWKIPWWATVHGVTKSQTGLSNFSFTFTVLYHCPFENCLFTVTVVCSSFIELLFLSCIRVKCLSDVSYMFSKYLWNKPMFLLFYVILNCEL